MASFVLIHGAWSGGYRWRKLRPFLTQAGHDIHAPSLTGMGDREHLLSRGINLETHVQDVANLIEYEDLRDIILVGHSYGGIVVTGAADRVADRTAHLVYVDAFVPADGQSVKAMSGGSRIPDAADGWLVPPISGRQWSSEAEKDWNESRRRWQPRATLEDGMHLQMPVEQRDFTRTFILAGADGETPFKRIYDRINGDARWRTFVFDDAQHMIPETHAEPLAKILLDLV